jgi:hypothetical protein
MPIRKFRSVEQMNPPRWYEPGDPALFRAIAVVWDVGKALSAGRFPAGVKRFRSADEMRRVQEEHERAYVRALDERRQRE